VRTSPRSSPVSHHQLGRPGHRRRQPGPHSAQPVDRPRGALGRRRLQLRAHRVDDQPVPVAVELVLREVRSGSGLWGDVLLPDDQPVVDDRPVGRPGGGRDTSPRATPTAPSATSTTPMRWPTSFPVVQMLNAAGYYTEPTPQNVAVSLLSSPGGHHRRQQPRHSISPRTCPASTPTPIPAPIRSRPTAT
jgi:hypothetical protein